MPVREVRRLCALALWVGPAALLLGCASTGSLPRPLPWLGFLYGFTRKTAHTAGGPAPALIVRLQDARLPGPVLMWTPIEGRARDADELPFLPTPDIQLRVPVELAGCEEGVFVANRVDDPASAGPLTAKQDVVLLPLPEERWGVLPADPCALAMRYGPIAGQRGDWFRVVTHSGVVWEYLVVESKPGYWVLVPFVAVAETTAYVVIGAVVAGFYFCLAFLTGFAVA